MHPTAPSKEAFENGNDRPTAHHRPKGEIIRWGYTGKQAAGRATTERPPTRRRVFTKKIP
ncbi:hypothetical protein F2Y51_24305 [Phocaeicola dorei]|uniref:Uncharacterized protein n=1 Tax=Phocaeicola dorei TaxID=357276 RepID=A0A4Q5HHK0_9BACT|nr:hypothetical protein F2Y58_24545 [Phocaeicola dorei]KAA5399820.1 hypothetical protein F2Y51_24305 [Phocaeicola dorei]RYT82261.1 hypothetical protein EAJ02_24595 [Phocaeicola dorei]